MEGLCKFCQAPYPQATNKLSTRHQQVNIATNVLLISHTYPIDIPYLYRYGISMGYVWDIYGTSPCLVAGKLLVGGHYSNTGTRGEMQEQNEQGYCF
jgi:hypothetical protein